MSTQIIISALYKLSRPSGELQNKAQDEQTSKIETTINLKSTALFNSPENHPGNPPVGRTRLIQVGNLQFYKLFNYLRFKFQH